MRFSNRIQQMDTSALREVLALTAKPDIISFAGDTFRFPSEPLLFRGNALLHSHGKSCIMSADSKKGRPGKVLPTPPGPMQENAALPHSRYYCACFSLYSVLCFLSRGEMRLCVCSGVGIVNPCAAFVVSRESPRGPGRKYHPQRLNR